MTNLAKNRPTSRALLARILDEPSLAAQIEALPAPALARLVERVGLEDAGEIVAFATTEQLAHVWDEDLWSSERAGEDERFDADRFVSWLEVLLEAGDALVARRLSELPPDLVTLAFHRNVLVVDLPTLMEELGNEEAAATEKALADCLTEEIDVYEVIARRHDGWDAILSALLALDRDHHDFLVRLLERCCAMAAEQIEDSGGLHEVLRSEEMLEGDVAGDREDRRTEAGHVAPSAAAAFLKLARDPEKAPPITEHDPLTRAWLRDVRRASAHAPRVATSPPPQRLLAVLRESGVVEAPMPLLHAAGDGATSNAPEPLLVQAMRVLASGHPEAFAERSEELAYLANVLAAGHSHDHAGRQRLRPIEAMRLAIATTSEGLERALAAASAHSRDRVAAATSLLRDHPADGLFRLAFGRRHRRD